MMLHRWKTAGVIFTGGQGTWVIKLAPIFHRQKKKLASPFHLPCQSTRPLWEVCVVRESEDEHRAADTHSDKEVSLQTCERLDTPQENTQTGGVLRDVII